MFYDNGGERREERRSERFVRQVSDHTHIYSQPGGRISANADYLWWKNHCKSATRVQVSRWILRNTDPKHWSNKDETLKLIDNIINPFAINKCKELKLVPTQKCLLVWDMFKAQATQAVKDKLAALNIEVAPVPANMTHFFQPLDLTVNGAAKKYMRTEFINYYSEQVLHQLTAGTAEDDIDVDLKLTTIKPLHAQWLVNLFNYLTSDIGKEIVLKGWRKAGISGLLDGSTTLPEADPFKEIYEQ